MGDTVGDPYTRTPAGFFGLIRSSRIINIAPLIVPLMV